MPSSTASDVMWQSQLHSIKPLELLPSCTCTLLLLLIATRKLILRTWYQKKVPIAHVVHIVITAMHKQARAEECTAASNSSSRMGNSDRQSVNGLQCSKNNNPASATCVTAVSYSEYNTYSYIIIVQQWHAPYHTATRTRAGARTNRRQTTRPECLIHSML